MTTYGFHASHEQIHPAQLLRDVQHAERAGFGAAMCSDHLTPWNRAQGHSGFSWSWLGAALATTGLRFGVVAAPGQRYHPVVVAHAMATLGAMFPGRFWAALASGEAMNEHVTGEPWPRKDVRDARLAECVDVIRRLLAGEEVTHDGLVTVDRARVWSLPDVPPPVVVPALSAASAERGAAWGDGLVTINQPHETLREVVAAYRDAGAAAPSRSRCTCRGTGTRAWPSASRTSSGAPTRSPRTSWRTWPRSTRSRPRHGTYAPRTSTTSSASRRNRRSTPKWLAEYAALGFDEIYLHHVGQEQAGFIDTFAEHVLPALRTEDA